MKTYVEEQTLDNARSVADRDEIPEVSVFLPVYNEEPNLRPLHAKLDAALKVLGRT